jgi:GNAT superfamily N-acetyltransferase
LVYRIRRVDPTDDDIAELLRELHDETFGDDAPQIDSRSLTEGWWWLAYAADYSRDIAGFCGLTPTYGSPRTIAYLKRAGVLLPHRGQGLQRRFIRVREMLARQRGFATIVTDTTDNPPSANTLIACGYRIYEPPEPWGFKQTIYWKKELND